MRSVSVVIPTYNRASSVTRAIRSALDQTWGSKQVIVVDDGSTDDTRKVLGTLRDRVKYVRMPNRGPAAARNRGLREASGDYVAFLDSDDWWHTEKLRLQVDALESSGRAYRACFSDAQAVCDGRKMHTFFLGSGFVPAGEVSRYSDPVKDLAALPRQPVTMSTLVVDRGVLESVGGFDEGFTNLAEDTDLVFRLSVETGFCSVNRILAYYEISERDAVSQRYAAARDPLLRLAAEERFYRKMLEAPVPRDLQLEARRRLSCVLSLRATFMACDGDVTGARRCMVESVTERATARNLAKLALVALSPALAARWCR